MDRPAGTKLDLRRDRYSALASRQVGNVFGAGHFTGVELETARHSIEYLARAVDDGKIEIDAFGLHLFGVKH